MPQISAQDAAYLAAQAAADALARVDVTPRQVLVTVALGQQVDGQDTALAPLGSSMRETAPDRVAETLWTHFVLACELAGVSVQAAVARYGEG